MDGPHDSFRAGYLPAGKSSVAKALRVLCECYSPAYFLMGFFASLGLGQGENYQLPKKWYWISLPVLFLTALLLTDAKHHLYFVFCRRKQSPTFFSSGYWPVFDLCDGCPVDPDESDCHLSEKQNQPETVYPQQIPAPCAGVSLSHLHDPISDFFVL